MSSAALATECQAIKPVCAFAADCQAAAPVCTEETASSEATATALPAVSPATEPVATEVAPAVSTAPLAAEATAPPISAWQQPTVDNQAATSLSEPVPERSLFGFFDRASRMVNPPPVAENIAPGSARVESLESVAVEAPAVSQPISSPATPAEPTPMPTPVAIAPTAPEPAAPEPAAPRSKRTAPKAAAMAPVEPAPAVVQPSVLEPMPEPVPATIEPAVAASAAPTKDTSCSGDSGESLRFGCKAIRYDTARLMWSRPSASEMGWTQAVSYCQGLDTDGFTDWRLPELKEIQTLLTVAEDGVTPTHYPQWLADHVVLWFNRSNPWGYVWFFRDDTGSMKPYYMGSSYSIFTRQQAFCVRAF